MIFVNIPASLPDASFRLHSSDNNNNNNNNDVVAGFDRWYRVETMAGVQKYSGNGGGSLVLGQDDRFGTALACLGDLNGDGTPVSES